MTDATIAEPTYEGTFSFLLDAPTEEDRARIQIAKLGKGFKDARYGLFDITADEVHRWAQNLSKLPGGRAPIDLDHLADRADRRTEAAGWITSVTLEEGVPVAEVEWTTLGKEAIIEKRYLFFSPTYGPWCDEHGTVTKDVLQGGALTNRPFLNMPTVCLSKAGFATGDATVLDAPVGIGVGDRVALSHADLSLGKEGVCVRDYPREGDGGIIYDVAWDDGTRSEGLEWLSLRSLTPWRSLTLSDSTEPTEPTADVVTLATLAATVEDLAEGLGHVTSSLSVLIERAAVETGERR